MIYLGYPIDHASEDQRAQIEDDILGVQGFLRQNAPLMHVYNPGAAFPNSAGRPTDAILRINQVAMARADRGLFFWPAEIESIGVPAEIAAMLGQGKPVAVVTDRDMTDRKWDRAHQFILEQASEAIHWLVTVTPEIGLIERPIMPLGPNEDLLPGGYQRVPLPVRFTSGSYLLPSLRLPSRSHPDDAGLDLFVSKDVTVEPGEFADVPCHIEVELPPGVWGLITGRSSTIRRRGLMVTQGVIDTGYRGELFSGVWNLTSEPVQVKVGERLAQLILLPNFTQGYQPVLVPQLADSERGSNGFGSSGY